VNRHRLSVCLSIRWIQNYSCTKHHQIARVKGIVMHGLVCVTVSPTLGGKLPAGQMEPVVLSSTSFSLLESGVFNIILIYKV
jgi:hypothetical protein